MAHVEEVGVILIHGIGDQGRLEHLDSQTRGIIEGLRRSEGRAQKRLLLIELPDSLKVLVD
ncbi:hypothetical protein [Lichenicoccus sp.]|uniref:hypothetical protein n=1 Tax=Lichenicoccus sp. TaxID=2781899 RepID=UPI003D0CFD7A